LEKLPPLTDPRVLVGHNTADDAGVVRLSDDLALVQTVDLFTPIVDDPYDYGRISAANSLSDVYAMGGTPVSALNIVGFPKDLFPMEVLADILRGAHDTVQEAGAVIVGGHTISDDELKFGLAVTGTIHPDRILANSGARPGDVLFLTKPLGTGTLTTALKSGVVDAPWLSVCIEVMSRLNRTACQVALDVGAHACTDITGFGLMGHALELAGASGVALELNYSRIPFFPDAILTTRDGYIPGGTRANRLYVSPHVQWSDLSEEDQLLLCDPQTSGGLLFAVAPERSRDTAERLRQADLEWQSIGHVKAGVAGQIHVTKD
jgi:selenide,water dikinase